MTNWTESELLEGLSRGEERAFDEVYRLHYLPLCYFAEKLTQNAEVAQDMVAESFVKLLQKGPAFSAIGQLKSYLYTVTRNACLDYLKADKRHKASHEELKFLFSYQQTDVESQVIRAEVLSAIYTAIGRLPEKYKQVIELALLEGYSNEQIGAATGLAGQSVRNRKSEGLRMLRLNLLKDNSLSIAALLHCLGIVEKFLHL